MPSIIADNDEEALYTLGWVHARDRLFQMDSSRRTFSGRLAELVGAAALSSDVQLRALGLRRAAEETLAALSEDSRTWLDAYADGVNAYLGASGEPLPQEYELLELSRDEIPQWTASDSLVILKGLSFGQSFDLSDLSLTQAVLVFEDVGGDAGFDGATLFSEDLYRAAPFDPAVIMGGFEPASTAAASGKDGRRLPAYLDHRTLRMVEGYTDRIAGVAPLRQSLERREHHTGSNCWVVSGALTESGFPLLANDPHLALNTPAVLYEVRLRVHDEAAPMDVLGVSMPGVPAVIQGCTRRICWGGSTNPLDVTDVYQETLVLDEVTGLPAATLFDGEAEAITVIEETFLVNQVGDGTEDNLVDAGIPPESGGVSLVVPRRNNGPIIAIDLSEPSSPQGLSVQFAGSRATREMDAFRTWMRAEDLDDFRQGLEHHDVGSQSWGYADVDGTIATFTSGEMPVREDLQTLGAPDGGVPPWLIRDGTHQLRHEWMAVQTRQPGQSLDFEVLAAVEMPQVVNPADGFIVSANNDPVGLTLDNDPLDELRPAGGVYYLGRSFAPGFRAGRARQMLEAAVAGGGRLAAADLMRFQANHRLLDAEVLVPYLAASYDRLVDLGAVPMDAGVSAEAVGEAVSRLAAWDLTTPTGIPNGYDPGDHPDILPSPSQAEIEASIAATIYAVWRGQVVKAVIDGALGRVGLDAFRPGSNDSMTALRHVLDEFETTGGVGSSGLVFIPDGDVDTLLVQALADALDLLAGEAFSAAFAGSQDQASYRWGLLHRLVLDHPLGGELSIPPAGGYADAGPGLRGLARSGGYGTVDAASHSVRADGLNEFMFGSGAARRAVCHLQPGDVTVWQVLPGGASGVTGSPHLADGLRLWLTNAYVERHLRVEAAPRRAGGRARGGAGR